jgi:hypothetical protein
MAENDGNSSGPAVSRRQALFGASSIASGVAGCTHSSPNPDQTGRTDGPVSQQTEPADVAPHDHSGDDSGGATLGQSKPVESITVRKQTIPSRIVRAYGANGNWSKDYVLEGYDIAPIVSTILEEFPNHGGRIELPAGIINPSQIDITTKKNLTLEGQGRGATVVRSTLDEPLIIAQDEDGKGSSVNNLTLRAMTLQGRDRNSSQAIRLHNAHKWSLENLSITGFNDHGIYATRSWLGQIINTEVQGSAGDGALLEETNAVRIFGGEFNKNDRGLVFSNSQGLFVGGTDFERNDREAFRDISCKGISITGAYFEANRFDSEGATVLLGRTNEDSDGPSQGISISGNYFTGGGNAASVTHQIDIEEAERYDVEINAFHNNPEGPIKE